MSFPEDLPSTRDIRDIRWTDRNVQSRSENIFSLQRDIFVWPGQRWEATISLRPMKREAAAPWSAWFSRLDAQVGTFLLPDPLRAIPLGTPTGTPLVDGGSQTGKTLATKGWTPNSVAVLKADDRIQIGAGLGARLHKVLDDVDADANGDATIPVWPAIAWAHDDETPLTTSNAMGLFELAQSSLDHQHRRRLFMEGLTFQAVSVVADPV